MNDRRIMFSVVLPLLPVVAFVLLSVAIFFSRPASPSEQRPWVDGLQNQNNNVCCYDNDGRRLDDPDWDTLGKVTEDFSGTSGYRVNEDGTMHDIPNWAVVKMKNQDGIARVWWDRVYDSRGFVEKKVRCFLPGSLT